MGQIDEVGVVRAASVCLAGEGAVTSMPVQRAAVARWLREAIQALLRISFATGFDARRGRGGDRDSDLVERQGASAFRRDAGEDGGEDTGGDSGGDSGEDTREEDKEERRRRRSTTTTTGRVDEDARLGGVASRSGVDEDGEGGTHGVSAAASIPGLSRREVLVGGDADPLTPRISAAARTDGFSLGARRIDVLGADVGDAAGVLARGGDLAP